ncbi:DUF4251 domain-containing protein [Maribacter sp. 2210JD10-5]|uniref:DUF4251 domain-containing protein n=1 Tax=Maribacter sp. 2210JD10-5 TaxID=3386272 RepID=UPI0039BD0FA8
MLKVNHTFFICFIIILILGCSSASKRPTNRDIGTTLENKEFKMNFTVAQPMVTQALSQIALSGLLPPGSTINRIDLNGDNNFFKMYGDSVAADLSYYGERQMGGGYTSKTGIVFQGVPKDLEFQKDNGKNNYTIKFTISSDTEVFMANAIISSNGTCSLDLWSSHRTRIRYLGRIEEIEEDKRR